MICIFLINYYVLPFAIIKDVDDVDDDDDDDDDDCDNNR